MHLYEDTPNRLTALWEGEVSLGSSADAPVPPADRTAALLYFWASRACTPEGDAVREVVASFLEEVVQESPWPVDASAAEGAESACPCEASLLDRLSL